MKLVIIFVVVCFLLAFPSETLYVLFVLGLPIAIIFGLLMLFKPRKKGGTTGGSDEPYTGRTHGAGYYGVYDDDGNFINVESGGFTEGLDGRLRDNYGHTVERDSDGEYRLL